MANRSRWKDIPEGLVGAVISFNEHDPAHSVTDFQDAGLIDYLMGGGKWESLRDAQVVVIRGNYKSNPLPQDAALVIRGRVS